MQMRLSFICLEQPNNIIIISTINAILLHIIVTAVCMHGATPAAAAVAQDTFVQVHELLTYYALITIVSHSGTIGSH